MLAGQGTQLLDSGLQGFRVGFGRLLRSLLSCCQRARCKGELLVPLLRRGFNSLRCPAFFLPDALRQETALDGLGVFLDASLREGSAKVGLHALKQKAALLLLLFLRQFFVEVFTLLAAESLQLFRQFAQVASQGSVGRLTDLAGEEVTVLAAFDLLRKLSAAAALAASFGHAGTSSETRRAGPGPGFNYYEPKNDGGVHRIAWNFLIRNPKPDFFERVNICVLMMLYFKNSSFALFQKRLRFRACDDIQFTAAAALPLQAFGVS